MKKFYLGVLFALFHSFSMANTTNCFDLFVEKVVLDDNFINLISNTEELTINKDGTIELDGKSIALNPNNLNSILNYQSHLEDSLIDIHKNLESKLGEVHKDLSAAFAEKLGKSSPIIKQLNSLYQQFDNVIADSVSTKNGKTTFDFKKVANFSKEAQMLAQQALVNLFTENIGDLSFMQNFPAIKNIVDNEWKMQKTKLKDFQSETCGLLNALAIEKQSIVDQIKNGK